MHVNTVTRIPYPFCRQLPLECFSPNLGTLETLECFSGSPKIWGKTGQKLKRRNIRRSKWCKTEWCVIQKQSTWVCFSSMMPENYTSFPVGFCHRSGFGSRSNWFHRQILNQKCKTRTGGTGSSEEAGQCRTSWSCEFQTNLI